MTIEVFIKKPEKVEVLKYDGTNYDEVAEFTKDVVKITDMQIHKLQRMVPGEYIIKEGNNIIVNHSEPDFAKQELIGSYIKDVVQGVNPNVRMSLEKLQEYFEVPIVDDRKKGVDKIASNNNCGVKKYQKKPIIVEAVQNTGKNVFEIGKFSEGKCRPVYTPNGYKFSVDTLEGTMEANVGDYIIKGVKGEFYTCKPDVFEATYDEYNEPQDSNHTSKPSNFSLRDLVMQIAPKHIKYYVKRLEEYGFEVKSEIILSSGMGEVLMCHNSQYRVYLDIDKKSFDFGFLDNAESYKVFERVFKVEVENNNWREAFNKLVASFPDEIMKNTNHHAGLTL